MSSCAAGKVADLTSLGLCLADVLLAVSLYRLHGSRRAAADQLGYALLSLGLAQLTQPVEVELILEHVVDAHSAVLRARDEILGQTP